MRRNVGTTDQVIRFLLGIGLMSLFVYAEGVALRWTGLGIGAALVLTSLFSFCPLYAMFGMNTREVKSRPPQKRGGQDKVTSFREKTAADKPFAKTRDEKRHDEDHRDAA